MKISSIGIEKACRSVWPEVDIDTSDSDYWLPKCKEVYDLVWDTFIDKYQYTPETFDCDDFSLILHAFIVQERYVQIKLKEIPREQWRPWAFGQARGRKFRGHESHHAINLCLTSDHGIVFIEPQSGPEPVIWEANRESDNPYSLRF